MHRAVPHHLETPSIQSKSQKFHTLSPSIHPRHIPQSTNHGSFTQITYERSTNHRSLNNYIETNHRCRYVVGFVVGAAAATALHADTDSRPPSRPVPSRELPPPPRRPREKPPPAIATPAAAEAALPTAASAKPPTPTPYAGSRRGEREREATSEQTLSPYLVVVGPAGSARFLWGIVFF